MIIKLWIILLFSIFFFNEKTYGVQVVEGRINLKSKYDPMFKQITLDGKWHFAWKRFVSPQSLILGKTNSTFINVPGVWNSQSFQNKNLETDGYSSFYIKVSYPKNSQKELSVISKNIWSAYKLYLIDLNSKNTTLIHSSGIVSKNIEHHKPQSSDGLSKSFIPSGDFYLLYHISNFSYNKSGIEKSIILGDSSYNLKSQKYFMIIDAIILGILIIMSFYHFGLFFQRKEDLTNLHFATVCLFLFFIQLVSKNFLNYFSDSNNLLSFTFQAKLYYISMYLSVFSLNGFINHLLFKKNNKQISKILNWITLTFILFTLVTNPKIFGKSLGLYQVIMLFYISRGIYLLFNESLKKNINAQLSLSAFIILSLCVINDILVGKAIIISPIITPYGFIAFVFIQSYILARMFSQTYRENQKLLNEIKIKEKQRTEIFHNTSHELRTPLNGIIGFCDISLNDNPESEISNKIKKIRNLAISLKNQVNAILDLAKFQKGDLLPQLSIYKTHGIFENIKLLAEGLSSNKSLIDFSFIISENPPEEIITDEKFIIGIIRNLLGNAYKFTENSKKNTIKIHFNFLESNYEISVEDTGIGISKENHTKIFKEFEQAESDSRRKFEGTGLGLSIVQKYTNALNGNITLKSEINKGTKITIKIPFLKTGILDKSIVNNLDSNEETFSVIKSHEDNEKNIFDSNSSQNENIKYKIAIIDDNLINLEVFEGILKSINYSVTCFDNGKSFVNSLDKHIPDLIILDLMMPVMSGEDVLKYLKNNSNFSEIPVILVTARASHDDKIVGLNLGADDYLSKPVDKDELLLKSKAILTRVELSKTMQALIDREKMAQVGEMLGEVSHEIKNLHISSNKEYQNELTRGLIHLIENTIPDNQKWLSFVPSLINKSDRFVNSKELKMFTGIENFDSNLTIPLKRIAKNIAAINTNDERKLEYWDIIKQQNNDKILEIYHLLNTLSTQKSSFDKSERTMDLVKGILDYTRADSLIQACRPCDVIGSTLNLLSKKMYYEGIEVINNIDQDYDPLISFVNSDLNQVILNLIGNAIDAFKDTNIDKKTITIEEKTLENESIYQILIIDNGTGIPKDIQSKIFERNFSTKGSDGSGLGLYICKKIILRNDSHISLESKPGETKFTLSIALK